MSTRKSMQEPVYLIDGVRTPFLKFRGVPGPFSASDLGVWAARALMTRSAIRPEELGEVITGCVMPSEDEANISRIIALRIGCQEQTPAWTVQRNCASGLEALDNGFKDIQLKRHHIVLAGGTEAMSRTPVMFHAKMVNWLMKMMSAKSILQRLKLLLSFRPTFLKPVIALWKGLTDPLLNITMGQTAENIAYRFGITRTDMDQFSVNSHHRLAKAQNEGVFKNEISEIYDKRGKAYTFDDGVRPDASLTSLQKLPPFFDKKYGAVTAGNSSQVSDGAAFVLMASESAVKEKKLPVLAKIIDFEWVGLDPAEMGLGPAHAIPPLLARHGLRLSDIDYFEINEAFAGQVIGCLRAWEDPDYCREKLGLTQALGSVDPARCNVDGGGVSLGHPIGASGARVVLHLAHVLAKRGARYGVASLCIGGGQGGAVLIENINAKTSKESA